MENNAALTVFQEVVGPVTLIVALLVVAWVIVTWLKVRSRTTLAAAAASETNIALSHENAALRTELGQVKDRLTNVERIAIDPGVRTAREIEALR